MARRAEAIALAAVVFLAAPVVARAQQPPAAQANPMQQPGAGSPGGTINLPNLPTAILQALPSYGTAPLTVAFYLTNGNPDAGQFVSYRWNFGDGQVSTLPPNAIFHIYKKPGTYVVTVTAATASGLTTSGFAGVTVTAPPR
jgi:PKD repeat protein